LSIMPLGVLGAYLAYAQIESSRFGLGRSARMPSGDKTISSAKPRV
jgi:hypothetical protein